MTEAASAFDALFPSPRELGGALDEYEGLWPENVEHVSASSLKTFAACPEQFRRRYLLGERQPPGAALVWGTADHKASEHNYRQKIESGADVSAEEVKEVYVAAVDEAVDQAGGLNALEWKPDERSRKKQVIADVKDRGVKGVEAYHLTVAPFVQPESVEEGFEVRVPGVPVPIIGYLDLVATDSERVGADARDALALAETFGALDGDVAAPLIGRRIIDRKTSGKKVSKPAADWSVQAGIYQLAKWLPHEWHITVKTQNPYAIAGEPALLVKASTARRRWVLNTLRQLMLELGWCYLSFGAEEPWPATRALFHDWRCSYCGYAETCEWRKGAL